MANFNSNINSYTDIIESRIRDNSKKLSIKIANSFHDNYIPISEDKVLYMVDEYVTNEIIKTIKEHSNATNDWFKKNYEPANNNMQYAYTNNKLPNMNNQESREYIKRRLAGYDSILKEVVDNFDLKFGELYENLLERIRKIQIMQYHEDLYYDIRRIINDEKETMEYECSLGCKQLLIDSIKKLQEVDYQTLGIIEQKDIKKDANSELAEKVRDNIDKLETESRLNDITRNYSQGGNIVTDYITTRTMVKIDRGRSFKLNDKKLYTDFAEFLSLKEISHDYTIFECIQDYLDTKFGKNDNYVARNQIYTDNQNVSITNFYDNNSAGSIERACATHNILKLMEIEDYLVIGFTKDRNDIPTPMAYNVIKSKNNLMLYDSYNSVTLEDGKKAPMVEIIEGATNIDDFTSYTPNLQTIPVLYGKKIASNYPNNREYISPNYYKNMNNSLSDKADELIRQMEKGIDVEGTGEYDVGKAYGKQMGYTMLSIVSLLSVIACIGIIILGIILK